MLDKLKEVEARYEELSRQLVLPEVINDRNKYREFSKEHSDLQPIIECYRKWQKVSSDFEQSKEVFEEAEDPEMRKMAQLEYEELKEKEAELDRELMILLLPKDPNDQKNVMLEIRAGAGGDEAALFAQELFEAYTRYAENRRWKVEIMSISYGSVGGYKEVIGLIRGDGAYSALKYESGVHRVQRVPQTETQGRVHTSTVTVAMLPEAEEVDIKTNRCVSRWRSWRTERKYHRFRSSSYAHAIWFGGLLSGRKIPT
jgi:peptide chain release factor 1